MLRRALLALLLVVVIGSALFIALAWRNPIAFIEPPARSSFDAAAITRGAALAAVGDCVSCHTAPEGKAYAGGRALDTPFGTIYSTNITPDADTGIGRWSQAAFVRAMREGVDREGRHLYPAFPYNYFEKIADDDLKAIYAFLMTREPVRAETPANELLFPMNVRMLLAGWKLLFLGREPFEPDRAQSEEWNRGAYLAQGLGHCGACHTPRNFLGAPKKRSELAGGTAEDWRAPALSAASRAPVPWTVDALHRYLRDGISESNEVAAGPMASVVHNFSRVPDQEVRAIATYVASLAGPPNGDRQERAERAMARARAAERTGDDGVAKAATGGTAGDTTIQDGRLIYEGMCLTCHQSAQRPRGATSSEALHLGLSTSIQLPAPGNLIRIIFQGIAPPDGETGPFMPGYAGALTDEQVAALVTYLRADLTDRPAWPNVNREVRRVRRSFASR